MTKEKLLEINGIVPIKIKRILHKEIGGFVEIKSYNSKWFNKGNIKKLIGKGTLNENNFLKSINIGFNHLSYLPGGETIFYVKNDKGCILEFNNPTDAEKYFNFFLKLDK